jgi:ATP-dependent Clp protease adapter protein ClpS
LFSEEDALEVMNLIHARGVGTVVLSSTELASPHRLGEVTSLTSPQDPDMEESIRI